MNVSAPGVAAFGSAAIASPPVNDANPVKRDDQSAPSPAQQIIEAAKPDKTGQFVDKMV